MKNNQKVYIYQCQNCWCPSLLTHKINVNNYSCSRKIPSLIGKTDCNGNLKYLGATNMNCIERKTSKLANKAFKKFHQSIFAYKLTDKLFHVLGYNNRNVRLSTQKASVNGVLMQRFILNKTKSMSHKTLAHLKQAMNKNEIGFAEDCIKKLDKKYKSIPTYHDKIADKPKKTIKDTIDTLKQDKNTDLMMASLQHDKDSWWCCYLNDDVISDMLYTYIQIDFTDGCELVKQLIKYMTANKNYYKDHYKDGKKVVKATN